MDEKIIRIRQRDRELFAALDPYDRLSFLSLPGAFGLGTLITETDGVRASGLLIGQTEEDTIHILWLGVDTELQGLGIGERLLIKVRDMGYEGDIERLDAVVSGEYRGSRTDEDGGSFFTERDFYEVTKLPPESVNILWQLKKLSYLNRDPDRLPKPVSLASLSPAELKQAYASLDGIDKKASLCELAMAGDLIDKELSFVFTDNGEAYEGIVVAKTEDCLLPVYFYAEAGNEEEALLISSYRAALKKYTEQEYLIIYPRTDRLTGVLERVFGTTKPAGRLLEMKL